MVFDNICLTRLEQIFGGGLLLLLLSLVGIVVNKFVMALSLFPFIRELLGLVNFP